MSEDAKIVAAIGGGIVAVLIALSLFIGVPIWVGTYYTQKSSCSNWGQETNRRVKFEVLVQPLGLPIEWDCFTTSGDGRWVPRDRVREIDP